MPTPNFTAADVMDAVAALMNDTEKQVYTYTKILPYLKIAVRELREFMALANIPVTNETSTVLNVPAGTTVIGFNTTPALPVDLMEIQGLSISGAGQDSWSPMSRADFPSAGKYAWIGNEIRIDAQNQIKDIKLNYIKQLLMVVDSNSQFTIVNGQNYLEYRTAGLCAEFIGENKARAEELNQNASNALDRTTGIETKARQGTFVRKRPFRAAWKGR